MSSPSNVQSSTTIDDLPMKTSSRHTKGNARELNKSAQFVENHFKEMADYNSIWPLTRRKGISTVKSVQRHTNICAVCTPMQSSIEAKYLLMAVNATRNWNQCNADWIRTWNANKPPSKSSFQEVQWSNNNYYSKWTEIDWLFRKKYWIG